jgi:hypothetical protein
MHFLNQQCPTSYQASTTPHDTAKLLSLRDIIGHIALPQPLSLPLDMGGRGYTWAHMGAISTANKEQVV